MNAPKKQATEMTKKDSQTNNGFGMFNKSSDINTKIEREKIINNTKISRK